MHARDRDHLLIIDEIKPIACVQLKVRILRRTAEILPPDPFDLTLDRLVRKLHHRYRRVILESDRRKCRRTHQ